MSLITRITALLGRIGFLTGGTRTDNVEVPNDERVDLLRDLESKIDYTFTDQNIFNRSLCHRSYVSALNSNGLHSYERLEFLGDACLGLIVSEFLYMENPDLSEGGLTRTKSSLVSREALVRCSEKLELGKYVLLSSRENLLEGRARLTILADCFEALLGAMYLDGGIEPVRVLLKKLLMDDTEGLSPFLEFHQAKNKLLRIAQEDHQVQPQYRIINEGGPEHDRIFSCEVSIEGKPMGSGQGKSKKEAEKWAALDALKHITNNEHNDN
jgi:ribonuclease-3